MTWIEPLALETWIINVFSGDPDIFVALAILIITSISGYFKMNALSLFFVLAIFMLMFSGFIGSSFFILFAIIGGLLIGYTLSQIFR